MNCCDFAIVLTGCASFAALIAVEVADRIGSYVMSDRRLFWCKRCGEFYMRQPNIEICECPKCGERNIKLRF
ncbi:MAG: hypothetical protein LBT64_01835 [Puniceicoccales bacterium]|nr:hypothetical protein [Puniceicoccales bacterium]